MREPFETIPMTEALADFGWGGRPSNVISSGLSGPAAMPDCVAVYRAIAADRVRYHRHPEIDGLIVVQIGEIPKTIVDLTHGGDLSLLPAICAAAADEHEAEHTRIWGKPADPRPQLEMEV